LSDDDRRRLIGFAKLFRDLSGISIDIIAGVTCLRMLSKLNCSDFSVVFMAIHPVVTGKCLADIS